MNKRRLTTEEIEDIIDFIEPNPDIPEETAMSIVNINKERLRNQLVSQSIYPELIPSLKVLMENNYLESLINPGQSVGIICAQSIGEKNTQSTLNTFHKAGQSEKSVLAGVPRFQEILNTTKEPKAQSCKIYFKNNNSNVKDLRKLIGDNIVEIKLDILIKSFEINRNKIYREWYDNFKLLYCEEEWFNDYEEECFESSISIVLNEDLIYKFNIDYETIVSSINSKFSNELCCIFSTEEEGILDIFVDATDIELPKDRVQYIDSENIKEIFIEEVVLPELKNLLVCGVEGIENIYYTYDDKGEWYVDTDGSNYSGLLEVPFIDKTRTVSNNMWEIYRVLGIEATREFLINECLDIMDSI